MEQAGYGFAALILAGGALVSVLQLIASWRSGACRLFWSVFEVRRADRPVAFHLLMVVWTAVCLFLAYLLIAASILLGRVALG